MMEGKFNAKLIKALREKLGPESVVTKISDAYTAGIPDFFVSSEGKTSWFESKLTTNKKLYEPLQLAILRKLRGSYVIWNPTEKQGFLLAAEQSGTEGEWLDFNNLVEKIIAEVKREL